MVKRDARGNFLCIRIYWKLYRANSELPITRKIEKKAVVPICEPLIVPFPLAIFSFLSSPNKNTAEKHAKCYANGTTK